MSISVGVVGVGHPRLTKHCSKQINFIMICEVILPFSYSETVVLINVISWSGWCGTSTLDHISCVTFYRFKQSMVLI